MKYIIANWKAHKDFNQTHIWTQEFVKIVQNNPHLLSLIKEKVKIIICPPLPFLKQVQDELSSLQQIATGAQDISSFEEGADTGEVTAKMLAGSISYTLVGHSERRILLKEDEDHIYKKVILAKKYHIEPILCIRDQTDTVYSEASFIAWEPVEAIGSMMNASIEQVQEMKEKLHTESSKKFIYGGSVDENNAHMYLNNSLIDGVLVGTASLDPKQFLNIIAKV